MLSQALKINKLDQDPLSRAKNNKELQWKFFIMEKFLKNLIWKVDKLLQK